MASLIYATECPHCGRSAIEDYYYKSDEKRIICYRCGFYYSKEIKSWSDTPIKFKEDKGEGYGVFRLVKKNGERTTMIFNSEITEERIDECRNDFLQDDTNRDNSFLATYHEGVFKIHWGTPSENYHLPFEQYKEKMLEKYGNNEFNRHCVPIED